MTDALLSNFPTLVITIAVLFGGLWVFKRSYVKQLGELQESVIATYKAQNEAQAKQIASLEKKLARMETVLSTLQITLKRRRGLLIEINDDLITLVDQRTGAEHAVQIHVSDQHEAVQVDEKEG
jgi:hypothetical protein